MISIDTIIANALPAPINREDWLERAANMLRTDFREYGYILPYAIRFACSWPSKGKRAKTIGEHWGPKNSGDGTHEIMISMRQDDPLRVLGILVHELCHAAIWPTRGHGRDFKDCAIAAGLCGKMRATKETAELIQRLEEIVSEIGPYPHAEVRLANKPTQTTRMFKCQCQECNYTVRVSRKWFLQATPRCPLCKSHMPAQIDGQWTTVIDGEMYNV